MLEISKWFVWLLSPLSAAFLLAIAAFALRKRRPRGARRLAVAAFAVLWLGSMPLTASLLAGPLEKRYAPVRVEDAPVADAIVVLGGALVGALPPSRPNMGMGSSADRVWQAAALYRAGKARWIVAAGGEREPRPGLQVEADAMLAMLTALGVPKENILLESASRTTRENAANTRPLVQKLRARRVLLVTSQLHLPRAVRTFEAGWRGTGIEIVPFPAEVSGTDDSFTVGDLLPSAASLRHVTQTLKEYAGTVVLGIMVIVTP